MFFGLAEPQAAMLESYASALHRDWSPEAACDGATAQLAAIEADAKSFIWGLSDLAGARAQGDGRTMDQRPVLTRWMWDGEFCGCISIRSSDAAAALPPGLSHPVGAQIGFAVVPWKRKHGYASRALRLVLDEVRELGLMFVEFEVAADNAAARIVVERNDGQRTGQRSEATAGGGFVNRYLIDLSGYARR